MNQGWVKLHRKLRDHPRRKDPEWVSVWIEIMLLATHQPIEMDFSGRIITLKPGQLITSRKSLSDSCGVSQSKTERVLAWMESEQQIEQQGSNRSRLITILNWDKYQPIGQQNEQPSDSRRTTNGQPSDTNKNERMRECKNKVFVKPSVEDVRKQCLEIGLPESESSGFVDYYESNGWRVGKNPMKSWEAALRNWKKNFLERGPNLFKPNSDLTTRYANHPCNRDSKNFTYEYTPEQAEEFRILKAEYERQITS